MLCTLMLDRYREHKGSLPPEISPALINEYGPRKTGEGVLTDPFVFPEYLRYQRISDLEFLLYSLGPDGTDQGGQIEYDPSNGTYSNGDITLSGFAERDWWEM